MDDLEHRLREAALSKPSAAHDAAMQRIFVEAKLRRPPFWSANVALWKSAAACALCLAFGFLLHAYVEPRPAQAQPASAVFVIPPDPAASGLFDSTRQRQIPTLDLKKIQVRVVPANASANETGNGSV